MKRIRENKNHTLVSTKKSSSDVRAKREHNGRGNKVNAKYHTENTTNVTLKTHGIERKIKPNVYVTIIWRKAKKSCI